MGQFRPEHEYIEQCTTRAHRQAEQRTTYCGVQTWPSSSFPESLPSAESCADDWWTLKESMVDGRAIPIPDQLMKKLATLGSSTLTAELFNAGFRTSYIQGVRLMTPGVTKRMVGRARTLRFIPLREDLVEAQYADLAGSPHRQAIESIERGDVLVIDTGHTLETGVLGDMFLRRIRSRGGVGVVIDGAFRDYTAVQEVGIPVFASGFHGGAIPHRLMSVGRDEAIRCGELAVIPGDVIVGDADGVVVIPPQAAEEVARAAAAHTEQERWIRHQLDKGGSLHDYYPPKGEKIAELESWLAESSE